MSAAFQYTHSNESFGSDNESGSEKESAVKLPSWARAAKQKDDRAQPWKSLVEGEDDPDFADGVDLSLFYKAGMTLCLGEGSLAA